MVLYTKQGYIWRRHPSGFDQVAGRIFGGDGSASYQLASRPYDEVPVHGHPSRRHAFEAAAHALAVREP